MWLITIKDRVVRDPFHENGGSINGGDPNHLLTGMILQIGDEILPSYVGIVINHDIRIPIEQPG